GLWAQVRHVANAPLPHFGDLDPSGRYGDDAGRDDASWDGDAGRRPLRLAVLGDSSMTGPGLSSPADIWIARAAAALGRPVELRSHARGGSRVRDVLEQQVPTLVEEPADLVVVSVGANDAIHATSLRSYARTLDRLLDRLAGVAPVVSLGIGDLSTIPRLPRTFRPVVARRSAAIDRAHTLVTADRDRVVRVPVSKLSDHVFRDRGSELFAADLFHPNRHGHSLWAELFHPYLERALDQHGQDVGAPGGADGAVVDLRTPMATAR
ncbi:MAG: SGNH/GDSL hydrolase family protein, partial [Microthrixaceae bacterium]